MLALERKLDNQIESYKTMLDKQHKRIIGKNLKRFLIGMSFLITAYLLAASFESKAVCNNWVNVYYLIESVPFSSDTETVYGNIMVDFIMWCCTLVRAVVYHTLFIWPLMLLMFLICSDRITVSWTSRSFANKNVRSQTDIFSGK